MEDYSFSVIVPNYNKSKYLKQCIESILSQTLLPQEVIVVDDCSSDDSIMLLDEMSKNEPLLKVVSLKTNGGVSNARNIGASVATSNYVKFIDADDFYYSNNNFEKEMELIKKFKRKKRDILAYSSIVFVDNSGELVNKIDVNKSKSFTKGKSVYDLLSRLRFASIANNFMVKKDIFLKSGGFDLTMNLYEDYEILIRLSFLVNFYFSKEYGRAYRATPDGLSKRPLTDHKAALNSIFKKYYSQLSWLGKLRVNLRIVFRKIKQRKFFHKKH